MGSIIGGSPHMINRKKIKLKLRREFLLDVMEDPCNF
jgi:hypothetical protein